MHSKTDDLRCHYLHLYTLSTKENKGDVKCINGTSHTEVEYYFTKLTIHINII